MDSQDGKQSVSQKIFDSAVHSKAGLYQRRLIIRQIVLQDFKSYGGEQKIGPFHKRFTSIIGPNGSGKSNVIDSLLFVFGKRAKEMRFTKLQELIHVSSDPSKQPKKASVSVDFVEIQDKQGEDYKEIEGTEFSVKRVVHLNGSSDYYLNRDKVKQDDVIDMLKSKGIDLKNNRFLILQGDVEQISLMRAKSGDEDKPGLLEYLDDIIGTNQYKGEMDQNLATQETLGETKREKGERMKLSKDELDKLEDAKQIAVAYIKLEKEIYQMQNIKGQVLHNKYRKELDKNAADMQDTNQKIREMKQEYKDKFQLFQKFIEKFKENKHRLEQLQDQQQKYQDELAKFQAQDDKLRKEMTFESQNLAKFKKLIEQLGKEESKLIDDDNEIKHEFPQKQRLLESLQTKREQVVERYSSMKEELTQNNQQLTNKKRQIEKSLQPFLTEEKTLRRQIEILENKVNSLQGGTNRQDYKETKAQLMQKLEELENGKRGMQDKIMHIDRARQNIALMISQTQNEIQNCQKDIKDGNIRLSTIVGELNRGENQRREGAQRNNIIGSLLQAQQEGILTGIYGRLGDLGNIDPRYDTAVTMACPGLENIVTRTYEEAQRALDFLKKNKIGRVTFIPLDRMREQWGNQMQRTFNFPQKSHRLFDLVRCKEEYKIAFYSQLRDTLVCDDIDIATSIAYGQLRYRVVTLDGNLIEITGIMSGGGKVRKGGMQTSSSSNIMQVENDDNHAQNNKLRAEQRELEILIDKARQTLNKHQKDLDQLLQDKKLADQVWNTSGRDIENQNQQIKQIQQELNMMDQVLSQDDRQDEVQKINHQIQLQREKLQVCLDNSAEWKEKLENAEREINMKGGSEFDRITKEKNQVEEDFKKLEKEVQTMVGKKQSIEENIKKNKKERENAEKKLKEIQNKIQIQKGDLTLLEEKASETLERLEQINAEQEKQKKENQIQTEEKQKVDKLVSDLKKGMEKKNSELEFLKNQEKQVLKQIEDQQLEIKKNREKYLDIISQYDFLDYFEEVVGFGQQPSTNNTLSENNQVNQSVLSEEGQEDGENSLRSKKRRPMTWEEEFPTYQKMNIEENINDSQLDSLEKYLEAIENNIKLNEKKIKDLQEDTNVNTIKEYRDKSLTYIARKKEFEEAETQLNLLKDSYMTLKKRRHHEFFRGFNIINKKLKETYQELTIEGDAELEMIDSTDPFAEGLNFSVRPPKKTWKQISKLSGGEKTLSSLSLIFALHYYKPTPLYFMDEIDAALDFRNVEIVAQYVKRRTTNAQFIIISLRDKMFELAMKLVGIYKTFDVSKTISIIPSLIEKSLKEEQQSNDQDDDQENMLLED